MLDFTDTKLNKIIVHKIGNKTKEEGLILSGDTIQLGEFINQILLKFFISPFKNESFYQFSHETDINLNETFLYVSKIFEDNNSLVEQSKNIATFLYEQSNHPKINTGEFYAIILKDCVIHDEIVDAVGLFKTENKDTYLKVEEKENNFEISHENGININKLDKGCLIFNTEKKDGYVVSIVDNINKSVEARYWKDDFLKIKPREDNYYFTQQYIDVCKKFAESEDVMLEKNKQIELKNDTLNYFKEKEAFNINEFEDEVIKTHEAKEAFNSYVKNFEIENDTKLSESFDISENAYKNEKRKFRSVIKLDKNFHIYIHGKQDLVEKGYDNERSLKYYKLFFNDEK